MILLVQARYCYLIKISLNRRTLMTYLAIGALIFSLGKIIKIKNFEMIWLFIGSWLMTLFYSIIKYDNSMYEIFMNGFDYLVIVAAIPIYLISKYENSIEWIEEPIIFIGTIVATLLTVQGLILKPMGISLIDVQFGTRMGGIRYINTTEPILFCAVLAFAKLLKKNKKIFDVIRCTFAVLISIVELVFISKTRALLLILFISMIVILWTSKVTSNIKELFRKTFVAILICVCVVGGVNTKIADAYFADYKSTLNTQYDTVSIRSAETEYAFETLRENLVTTLVGTGFIPERNNTLSFRGSSMKGLRTDLGVVGFINEFGVLGMLWLVLVIVQATLVLIRNSKSIENRANYVGLYSVFILGFPTLFLFNGERMAYFPIWLGIMMYYKDLNEIKNENGDSVLYG